MIDMANVSLYGYAMGTVAWLKNQGYAVFEFEPSFIKKQINPSPLKMATDTPIHQFPFLNFETYRGLPGLLADALPDKFGDSLIDIDLALRGLTSRDINPINRLCYQGTRSMGALEFQPAIDNSLNLASTIDLEKLVGITQQAMTQKTSLNTEWQTSSDNQKAIAQILSVGTSAGGARPKAVIAMNHDGHILSGQTAVPEGYEHYLLKFDGVTDGELGKPNDYGKVEYAYSLMATAAGINMTETRLLEENGRHHFLTLRFDRINNQKIHMQTLCGLAHFDYRLPGHYSYEQAFSVMRELKLNYQDQEQLFRRMVFNVVARNQDDHTKNISFLMDKDGKWLLSPAYDITYSHNPAGQWTNQHQMSINGKRDHFERDDFLRIGESIGIKQADQILDEIIAIVSHWQAFAKEALLDDLKIQKIAKTHRLNSLENNGLSPK